MAGVEDLLKNKTTLMIAAGVGVAVLAPVLIPIIAGAARPLARAAIKTGIIMYEKGREAAAEVGEVFDDLVAEARSEMQQNHAAKETVAATATGAVAVAAPMAATSPPAPPHE